MLTSPASDGRLRRGQRSRAAMVQALFDLVGEGVLQPTAQQVADRAGVLIRTVFRHFADMESLLSEVNGRVREITVPIFREARADGSLEERARGLVERRVRLFERIAPYKRSGNLQRWRSRVVEREQAIMVRQLRADLLAWLPELRSARPEIVEALDVALCFEVWDRLRTDQRLGPRRARAALERIVAGVLNAAR
jgi:AcrR family transcriptional regulator